MRTPHTRRRFLGAVGAAGVAGVAGCTAAGPLRRRSGGDRGGDGDADADPSDAGPPARTDPIYQPWDHAAVRDATVSGGPEKDGIPSVDDPQFVPAADASLAPDDVVFGYAGETDVTAYPQSVLVWHEVANDVLDGTPVAVTYCPLTGTAMGFERGETTFGVSGRLVNNNLVLYDRATDSRWPQVLATAVSGPREGDQLREVRLVWTTWSRWREAHPDTRVMTENTGYARRYGSDPYGNYNPTSGYYASGSRTLFPPLDDGWRDVETDAKRVVFAVRTADRVVAFDRPALARAGRLATADGALIAAYDPALDTAWAYRGGDAVVAPADDGDGRVVVDGDTYRADALPLEPVSAVHAMWHAVGGFYPEAEYVARE
ncbi:DUF3179 domain-containing protein [Halobaculum lipolyticum]|uniref:DUF3179 domain-containing protein n=1 Tax=Halobaculum lipolyticum TaxID=3032001 RepID=A0ABD5WBF2_9EURY|nr:DUF3179 domain-containing protein [Halobaculum sp. DT31]